MIEKIDNYMKIKILLGGQFKGYHSENFVFNAFKQLGADISIFDFENYFDLSLANRVINKFRKTPYYFNVQKVNKALIEEAQKIKPNIILLFKPILIKPETVKALTKIAKTFVFHTDHIDFPKNYSSYFYKSLSLYDLHISGNQHNIDALLKRGAKKSMFLPLVTADASCFHPVQVTDEDRKNLGADVIFAGTYAKEKRSEYLEKLCQEGYDVKVYGTGWGKMGRKSCLIKNRRAFPPTYGETSRQLCASKIALAFVREHNYEMVGCRTLEIPLCGVFMLHQRTERLKDFFEEGKEVEAFESYEEMKSKIDFYLKNEALRNKIAQAGYKRVTESGHLIIDQVKRFLELYV